MSYCRFSEGDVYMYPSVDGTIVCQMCLILIEDQRQGKTWNSVFTSLEEAYEHLQEHLKRGHTVPERAFIRLRHEILGEQATDIEDEIAEKEQKRYPY